MASRVCRARSESFFVLLPWHVVVPLKLQKGPSSDNIAGSPKHPTTEAGTSAPDEGNHPDEYGDGRPGDRAQAYNRAGDRCLGDGDRENALRNYGRAIDLHLETGRYNAAAGLCRKILRVAPGTVRTRCTLAWLALGRGEFDECLREIGAYVDAGVPAGQKDLVIAHLRIMAGIARAPDIRDFVADALDRLNAREAAAAIRRSLPDTPPARPTAAEQESLWRSVVEAATRGPAGPAE